MDDRGIERTDLAFLYTESGGVTEAVVFTLRQTRTAALLRLAIGCLAVSLKRKRRRKKRG